MTFYKIENGLPQIGSGTKAPEGFIEYTPSEEPKELLTALKKQETVQKKEQKLQDAKQTLNDTDWIITKMQEYVLMGLSTEEMTSKYSKELKQRQDARATINKAEK